MTQNALSELPLLEISGFLFLAGIIVVIYSMVDDKVTIRNWGLRIMLASVLCFMLSCYFCTAQIAGH